MVARVTLAEVDTVRMRLDDAIELFKESVIPALHEQEGYAGAYVLATPAGKALAMSFWESEEAADVGLANGFYREQVEKFVTFFRAPPGRETYQVVAAEAPLVQIE
jgi:heme-degrading monooxygenase HmoA